MNDMTIPLSEEDYNNLKWEHSRVADLMKELQGYNVSGVDPIIDGFRRNNKDDLIIGGVDLYLTRSGSNQIKIISLFTEIIPQDNEEDGLKMSIAYY